MAYHSIPTATELATSFELTEEELSVKVTNSLITNIVQHMNNWRSREIAPFLGLAQAEREDIIEIGKNPDEQRLLMLEKWTKKYGKEASFFGLVRAFLKAKRRDLAEEVLEFFKQNGNQICIDCIQCEIV